MYNFSIGFCAVSTSPPCDSLTRQSHSIVATHRSRLRYAQHISSALRIGGYSPLVSFSFRYGGNQAPLARYSSVSM